MPKLGLLLVFLAKLRLATAATALGAALCAALVAGFREVVLEVHSLLEQTWLQEATLKGLHREMS